MKKHHLAVLVLAALGMMAVFAPSAMAFPTQTNPCTGCHATNAAVTVIATPGTVGPTSTSYTITAANSLGAVGWAVFQGSTKIAGAAGSGGVVDLTNGVTYTVFGAGLDGSANTIGKSISVTPAAPKIPDVTAPKTTSDVKSTYAGSAVIHLLATDNAGGSGVAHTYYIFDSSAQTEGNTISTSVVGTHTIEFWSVDASGNVEAPHSTASFTLTPAPTVPAATTTYSFTYKFKVKNKVYKKLKAVLLNKTTLRRYTVLVSKKGVAKFSHLPAGSYRLSTAGNAKFKFKARTVRIGLV